tara:strand:+ start:1938 stop:2300 length:363 start_codon:yes stop_codon:yes gene_type:complete
MNTNGIQTAEQMINRWQGVKCTCDSSVGWLCEICHDTQVVGGLKRERDACADAMDQEHDRCLALEEALRLIVEHQNTDIAALALRPEMACRRCNIAATCEMAFEHYNLDCEPKIDCLATK